MKSDDDALKDAAFRASVTALSSNIVAYGKELLDLDENENLGWSDAGEPACIRISTGQALVFPVLCIDDAALDGRTPKVALDTMGRAFDILAFARTWKAAGTKAPPVGLIGTSNLTLAVIETFGINPQALADQVWEVGKISPRYSEVLQWRSAGERNKLIAKEFETYTIRDLPKWSPWMAGYSSLTFIAIEAVKLGEGVVIQWAPQRPEMIEVRLDTSLPAAVVMGLPGKSFPDVLDHPLAKRIEAKVVQVQQLKASTRIKLRMQDTGPKKLGEDPLPLEVYQQQRRKLAGARQRLQAYTLGQLTPPVETPDRSLVDSNGENLGIPGGKG